MFTGIIEEVGEVTALTQSADVIRLSVLAPLAVVGTKHGDSISVNGVCLTVVDQSPEGFTVDVMQQTLDMSTIGSLQPGDRANLERAAMVGDRIGGHIVQGHVDGTSTVLAVSPGEAWSVLRFSLSDDLAPLVVDQGSIAVAGVSLTVSAASHIDVDGGHGHPDASRGTAANDTAETAAPDIAAPGEHWFEVSLIPETLAATTLGSLAVGDVVNIETDILARHVERLLSFRGSSNTPAQSETPAQRTN
ncbi:riboflavin synthase [Subtercola endophyticus]|uniref:riboflavin synthase n=1 Tax=Subtercola endophyticus TaxID=2895559 RepID=UPI001E4060DB|nr:riboflavin synthase [Subtercola endophyticus]UFS57800.1 riboflavin synthase [Subtercola endophyticus]